MMIEPKFKIGQVVRHVKVDYRGVIYDVDLQFGLTERWYERMARSRPPKDRPWYRVLVDGSDHETYVAERHLASDERGSPIRHPEIEHYFDAFRDGYYARERDMN